MGQPITILGSTHIWPTTGDTGYSAETLEIIRLLTAAVLPIQGLYNTSTGEVGNIGIDDNGDLILNGLPISGGSGGGVTSVAIASATDLQVTGSPITTAGIIDLALTPTGVVPGIYNTANVTVDSKGRITAISNGPSSIGTVTTVSSIGNNGVITSVANPNTTPTITIGLGDISPLSATLTSGNLTFTGANQKIVGDFTGASRISVQTSVLNSQTTFGLLPSGTNTNSSFVSRNTSDINNNGFLSHGSSSSEHFITTGQVGTGSNLPLNLKTNNVTALSISAAGPVSIATSLGVVGAISGSNLSGTNTGNQTITLSGDATGTSTGSPSTSLLVTLKTIPGVQGAYTTANITVDAQGRITAASNGSVAWGSITGDITTQTDLNDVFTMIGNVAIGTGVTTTTDTVGLIALNDTTVRLKATQQAVFSALIPAGLANADRTFPQQDFPLSSLTFPSDGIYVRFIGVDVNGLVVTSPVSFKTSPSVLQYGYLLVKQVGGVKTFLDGAAGPRNVFTWPDFAGNNAAESEYFTPITNIIITPNANLTVKNSSGVIKGLNINWGTSNVNEKAILSQDPTTFTTINPSTALAASLPPPGTAVQVTQFWNGTAMQTLSGANTSTVQRFFVTIAGGLFLQVGEAQYANFAAAIDNISVAPFTNIIPEESFIEIVRFASRNGSTNLSNNSDAVFQSGSGSGGGGGGGGSSAGTVTSVNISGLNGVTSSGGPITSSGSITVGLGAITPSSVTAGTITSSGNINAVGNIVATGTVTGSNLSGTNTGNQTITLTGGVTGSGTGSFPATVVTNANLTGDVTSVGNATTLPVVNPNVGTFTNATVTVNAKGQVTAASNGTGGGTVTSVGIASTTLTSAGGPITTSGSITVNLPAQTSAGTYTNANVTIDGFGRVTAAANGSAGGGGTPAGSNTQIQYNNAGAFGASANLFYDGTKLSVANTLEIQGAAGRITGDFANATPINRTFLQNRTGVSPTFVGIVPSSSGTSSSVQVFNNNNPTNSPYGELLINTTGFNSLPTVYLNTSAYGSGTTTPLILRAGPATTQVYLDTLGNVVVGNTTVLSNNATDGFLHIPGMSSLPQATPNALSGFTTNTKIPFTIDTSTGHLWTYANGAWHDPTVVDQNIQSVNYTTGLADAGRQILHPAADTTARTYTIAALGAAYKIGTRIEFANQTGAGEITITSADTMTWTNTGTSGTNISITLPAGSNAVARKISNAVWQVSVNTIVSGGGGGGSTAISALTSAVAANTLGFGNFQQVWELGGNGSKVSSWQIKDSSSAGQAVGMLIQAGNANQPFVISDQAVVAELLSVTKTGAVLMAGSSASLQVVSPGNLEFSTSSSGFSYNVPGSNFKITPTGEFTFNAVSSTAGDILTSGGPGVHPSWSGIINGGTY